MIRVMKRNELKGKKFGHLTVIELHDLPTQGARWLCRCSCGDERIVRGSRLVSGKTHSCGRCSKRQHGQAKGTKEYLAWKAMKSRCLNKNNRDYPEYGGRGIQVHKKWLNSFSEFFSYLGKAPSIHHSLDRYPNNNGNYEPGNVRWATSKQQNNNRRKRRWAKKPRGDEDDDE